MQLFRMFNDSDLVIDALLGYSLKSDPRYPISEIINQVNSVEIPVLSLDIPSGLDATTGKIYNLYMIAEKTLTLASLKKGLLIKEAHDYIGDLYLADIGISPILYREIGIKIGNIFNKKSVIQIY
jgi:NAD(P)H-hydrate epimerase